MTKTALFALAMCTATSVTAAAQDQESGEIDVNLPERKKPVEEPTAPRAVPKPGPLRVYGGFAVAVGGQAKYDFDGAFSANGSADLDPTVGLQGGADYVLMDYFSIGGEMRFWWWKQDEGDRNFWWDLDVKPRGRYAFGNLPLEVYGALPLGLTVPALSGEPEGKVGFNLGLVAGANWFFTENLGVNAEMGWVFHRFGLETPFDDATIKTNQFLLLCPNFVYAL